MNEKRSISRNKMWPETQAVIKYRDPLAAHSNTIEVIKAKINDLGSQGAFFESQYKLIVNTELDILIDFNPSKTPKISMEAKGIVLRSEENGFAVRFTEIDPQELGDCIMQKLNG